VAQVLLGNLNGSTDPQIMAIQNNLAAASTAQQVNEIIESTQPTVDGSASAGSFDFSDQTFDLADDQLFALRTGNDVTGMAAGDATHGMALWGEMFGQHANQGDRDGIDGYNSNTWGGAIGVDTRNVSDRAVIGIAGSYGRTNASSDNANATDTNIDSYQATLYGNYNIARATYVDAMAAYGWNKDDTTRYNVGAVPGLTAHGSFNARQISARVGAGRDFDVDSTVLTPNVLVHWVNYNPDSYTETGAGGADLHVNGNNLNLLELGLGVKAGWSLKNADGSMFKPQLHAGYRYAAVDSRVEDTSSFTAGGGTFTTQGATPDRSRVDLGAAIKFQTTNNWDLTASYDFNWRSDYTSHAGFLRAGYKF
jgi:outer membrane autotransporter protein